MHLSVFLHVVCVLILKGGSTALHVAAYNGMDATVTLLLNRGAEIEAKNNVRRSHLGINTLIHRL